MLSILHFSIVFLIPALFSTVSALRGGFEHSLPCRIVKLSGAPKVRWMRSSAVLLGK